MPGILFWLLLPLHLSVNLAALFWFSMKGQGGVIFKAKKDAFSGLVCMWRKRRCIQEKRAVSVGSILKLLKILLDN